MLHNIPEEQRPQLRHGGSLKSHNNISTRNTSHELSVALFSVKQHLIQYQDLFIIAKLIGLTY
jgi:hypothetical protein